MTPVRTRAAVRISRPRIMMAVSLPNPWKAISGGKIPVNRRAIITPRAMTSAGMVSIENKTRATMMMIIKRMMFNDMEESFILILFNQHFSIIRAKPAKTEINH